MQELDDIALLRQYAEENSEEAFALLVARHVNKVYSVALRHTRNPHQAEEITHSVFVILAKKARHIGKGVVLSGWLYQTARLAAVSFLRSEIRRTHREQEAHMQNVLNETTSDVWLQIAPSLDAAMGGLNEPDRHAVVLRFFDECSMREVGAALGISEDAAKKRVSRAVEKLRLFFTNRGVTFSSAVLQAAISADSVQAAPVGLAKAISVAAIAKGATASSSILMVAKGLLKPVFTFSGGTLAALAPLFGSVFFHLKAEIEIAKSPRERRFIIRMIWVRFTIALLGTAVPLVIALLIPSIIKQPGIIEYGMAAYFFSVAALLILLWSGFASFRWVRNWRQRPRLGFYLRFGTLAKITILCAVMPLLAFDVSWAQGRLHASSEWAIAFNILMVLAHVVLIKILARWHRPLAATPDSPSISTETL